MRVHNSSSPSIVYANHQFYVLPPSTVRMTNVGPSNGTRIRLQICHAQATFLALLVLLLMPFKWRGGGVVHSHMRKESIDTDSLKVVRCYGIPFRAVKKDIQEFFARQKFIIQYEQVRIFSFSSLFRVTNEIF